jgi:hypothetical protein
MMTRLAATMTLSASLLMSASAQQPTYRITHTYPIGGDGFWDYVVPDPPNHRLFIVRQTRVMVVDEIMFMSSPVVSTERSICSPG